MSEPMPAASPQPIVNLQLYNNSWYSPGPRWKILLWIIVNALFFNNGFAVFSGFKCFLLRLFGARVGRRIMIKPSVNIKYPWYLEVHDDAWIGENVWIDNLTTISIGKNACISQGAMLLTGNHDFNSNVFELVVKKIVLEDGVWIGARAIVCPGVTCHSHAVLAVASVAAKDLDAYSIYRGNPAEKVKDRIIKNQ